MSETKKQWDSNLTDYMVHNGFDVEEIVDESIRNIMANSLGFHQYKMALSLAEVRKAVKVEMKKGLSRWRGVNWIFKLIKRRP